MIPTLRLTAMAALALGLLTACSPTVPLEPADYATDPECAAVIVRLPDTVGGGLESRTTDAQATAAWGNPADVLLRCGVEVPGPTAALPCFTVEGVDWLRDASNEPITVFTTYGRDPAVELIIDGTDTNGPPVVTEISRAVAVIEQERYCVGVEDVFEDGVPVPQETPAPGETEEPAN